MNFALNTVTGRHELDHTWDVREELDYFTAQQLYELHSLNFIHEIHCNIKAEPLSSQFQVNSSVCSRTLDRSLSDLALPRVSTGAGGRRLLGCASEDRNLSLGAYKREVLRFSGAWMDSDMKCSVKSARKGLN